jgi:hypothetical protein
MCVPIYQHGFTKGKGLPYYRAFGNVLIHHFNHIHGIIYDHECPSLYSEGCKLGARLYECIYIPSINKVYDDIYYITESTAKFHGSWKLLNRQMKNFKLDSPEVLTTFSNGRILPEEIHFRY